MLSTKVILLDVTNLSDARYAAGMGVDYIGFSINPASNNYVTSEDVNAITKWLSGVSMIGNIGNSMVDYDNYDVDYLLTDNSQLINQFEEPVLALALSPENVDDVVEQLNANSKRTSFFVLKIEAYQLDQLKNELMKINRQFDCYIATEYTDLTLPKVLACKPAGIVLYGSHEEKPGLSNYDGIADVLELLYD